ncbi:MAG: quinol monooxygenase YgiN [Psychromonas sp.]|jgi:quinol monooxygenase YgiN|uniref:antibiotic biosynthesis monooxygenase family protein n=1 Tax=Psychromonas sp. TaxID=1884585 RepID=UPI0039E5AA99
MYTVLYRWKIHHGKQDAFISGWEVITDHYLANHGALGARLHKISDNNFAAYAQWASKEARDIAFSLNDAPQQAVEKMQESIISSLYPIEMYVISDKLNYNKAKQSNA